MKKLLIIFILFVLPAFIIQPVVAQDAYPPVNYDEVTIPANARPDFSLSENPDFESGLNEPGDNSVAPTDASITDLPPTDSSDIEAGLYVDDPNYGLTLVGSWYNWILEDFTAEYHVNTDSTIDVRETILADFLQPQHGIYRYIPIQYKDGQGFNYKLRVGNVSVSDKNGIGRNIAERGYNPLYLKIGDPDFTVTGLQTYVINYNVTRGIRYFDDHDELYFNITGHDWDTYIANASATVSFDRPMTDDFRYTCYVGALGSNSSEFCDVKQVAADKIEFTATKSLLYDDPAEDFTIAVWLPKGFVVPPTTNQTIIWWLQDNWGLFLAPIIFVLMFWLWRRKGRDPKFTKTVIAQYSENSELSPIVADVLLHDKDMDTKAISAEIVYLASHGYLTIREILKENKNKVEDYELTKIKEPDEKLKKFQKILMFKLFNYGTDGKVKLKADLEKKFYNALPKIKQELKAEIKPYYTTSPEWKIGFMVIGGMMAGFGLVMGLSFSRLDIIIGLILGGLFVMIFGWFMAKKTSAGQDLAWYAAGLKEFIKVTDQDRAKVYEDHNMFVKGLPYAMVFGLADKWGKAFDGIYLDQPDWYQTTRLGTFNTILFASSLSSFSSTSSSHGFAAPSSSSGFGGGAGGGFGGGGGGSW